MKGDDSVRILDIIHGTTVDGPGFRTSIYVSGCRHRCPECHNPESWDFNAGEPMTVNEIESIIREEDFDITLSGGDPMYQPGFVKAIGRISRETGHTLWVYTGFTWEDLVDDVRYKDVLPYIDVMVDGPFRIELKDRDLLFRGSSNQRIIDVASTLNCGNVVLWHR